MARARGQIEAQVAFSREGTYGTARTLGEAIAGSDWEWWVDYLDRVRAVTPEQIKAAAVKYLGPDQITVGWFVPKSDQQAGAGSAGASGRSDGGSGARRGADDVGEVPTSAAAPSPRSSAAGSRAGADGGAPSGAVAGRTFRDRTKRLVLPNGAVILLLPSGLSDTVAIRARIRAGTYLDGAKPGLAEATAGMLGRGTRKRKKIEIARQLESVGSSLTWHAEAIDVVGTGACLSRNLPELLGTIVEEIGEPAFDPEELAKLKNEMKAAILEADNSTTRRAFQQLSRAVYPAGHPLRASTAREQQDALESMTPDTLRSFHAAHYGASGIVISVCGRFDADEAAARITKLAGGLPRGKTVPPEAPRVTAGAAGRYVVHLADKANVDILIGEGGGLRRDDPDYYAAILANSALGQSGLSSRLGVQVRDTEGLTYTIVSRFFAPLLLDGPWGIYLSVAPANVGRGTESVMEVLRKYLADGITGPELAVEKSAAAGRFQVSLASNGGIADALAMAESYGLGVSLLDEYPGKVRAVTVEEANRAFRSHIGVGRLVTVISGTVPE
jgi:zinc protease